MPQLIHRALRGKVILQILQDRVRTALPGLFHGRSQLLAHAAVFKTVLQNQDGFGALCLPEDRRRGQMRLSFTTRVEIPDRSNSSAADRACSTSVP